MVGLRSGARRLLDRYIGGTAVVLIYHRVAQLESDPQLLAVSPEHFDAQMQLVAEAYQPISLDELAAGLALHSIPDRSVAVTFDDGYADNVVSAEPILAARGVPATVFVSSGSVASDREFWWDELEQILLNPGVLPQTVDISAGSFRFSATLGDAAVYSEQDAADQRDWTVLDEPRNTRQRAYLALAEGIRPLPADSRIQVLDNLHAAAGTAPVARPSHRQMTAAEVSTLDSSPFVDIGGHTVSHQLLASRPVDEQRTEILDDRAVLSKICARPIGAFSYPYGGLDDYSEESVGLVREAGFEHACSNHPGLVKPWTDPYRLPRHIVRDWPAEEFAQRIRSWFDGAH